MNPRGCVFCVHRRFRCRLACLGRAVATLVTILFGQSWQTPRKGLEEQVENKQVAEVVQLQTHYIQELKKYCDAGLLELWNKLRDIWNSEGDFCRFVVQGLDKQGVSLGTLGKEYQLLVQVVQDLAQQQLPELVQQVDQGFQQLANVSHSCFTQLDGQVSRIVSDL